MDQHAQRENFPPLPSYYAINNLTTHTTPPAPLPDPLGVFPLIEHQLRQNKPFKLPNNYVDMLEIRSTEEGIVVSRKTALQADS
jgi:hypothetical protein